LHREKIALLAIVFFSINFIQAQSIEPKGVFVESELKIGEEVSFALSIKYDKNLNILFPDSTYNFGTFEYNSRTYFKTRTDSAQSYDSVVYKLSTFEIDSIQFLQLPVFIINEDDSMIFLSNIDSIQLIHVVTEIQENPELKANTELVDIHKQFNYPYFLIALGIIFILTLAVALFFGKQLVKAWKIYRLNRIHKKFIQRFFNLIRDVSSNNPNKTPEHVLAVWKRYMERLEKKPISKLTTKEILVLHNNGQLKDNLRIIDRSIYGGEKGNDLFASFDYLMKFSIEIFDMRITGFKKD